MWQISQVNSFLIYDLDTAFIVSDQCYTAPGLLWPELVGSISEIVRKNLSIRSSFLVYLKWSLNIWSFKRIKSHRFRMESGNTIVYNQGRQSGKKV